MVIALLLAYAQAGVVSRVVSSAWLLYMLIVSAARALLVRRYWRMSSDTIQSDRWNRSGRPPHVPMVQPAEHG